MDFLIDRQVELSGPRLSESDVASFEAAHGVCFPDDYRRFMLAHNGGLVTGTDWHRPDQGVVTVTWNPGSRARQQPSIVSAGSLFALSATEDQRFENLAWVMDDLKEIADFPVLPDGAVPIGNEPGGNLFVLMCRAPLPGIVLYWDRTIIEGVTLLDLGYVACSFAAFIIGLREQPGREDTNKA